LKQSIKNLKNIIRITIILIKILSTKFYREFFFFTFHSKKLR
jgi:hypothetical protein